MAKEWLAERELLNLLHVVFYRSRLFNGLGNMAYDVVDRKSGKM